MSKGREVTYRDKGKGIADATRNREVKYFRCLGRGHYATNYRNRRVMVIKDGAWYTVDEEESKDE